MVNRFELEQNPPFGGQLRYSPDGYWVTYEDYAAKCLDLESSRVTVAALERDSYITAKALNQSVDMCRSLDAKLAALKAKYNELMAIKTKDLSASIVSDVDKVNRLEAENKRLREDRQTLRDLLGAYGIPYPNTADQAGG